MIPGTLDEAVEMLYKNLTEAEKNYIKQLDNMTEYHHNIGRLIRNGWGLWNQDSMITKYFRETYDITHADDISSMILDNLLAKLKKEEYNPFTAAKKFIDYWKDMNIQ